MTLSRRLRIEVTVYVKVIFLDCDGVLNRRPTVKELMGDHHGLSEKEFQNSVFGLNEELVSKLKSVVDETGSKIVASTSWRYFDDHPFIGDDWRKTLAEMIGKDKSVFIGSTPILDETDDRRGKEIASWIDGNLEPGKFTYCVVDDNVGDIIGIIPSKNVVKTDEKIGLTDENADRMIKILNGNDK